MCLVLQPLMSTVAVMTSVSLMKMTLNVCSRNFRTADMCEYSVCVCVCVWGGGGGGDWGWVGGGMCVLALSL